MAQMAELLRLVGYIMSYHHLSRFQIFSDKSHLNSFKIHELSHFRLVIKKKKTSRFFRGYPPRNQLATREAYATVANFGG